MKRLDMNTLETVNGGDTMQIHAMKDVYELMKTAKAAGYTSGKEFINVVLRMVYPRGYDSPAVGEFVDLYWDHV